MKISRRDFTKIGCKVIGGNIAEGEAPHELEDLVREAADTCPGQIIHVK